MHMNLQQRLAFNVTILLAATKQRPPPQQHRRHFISQSGVFIQTCEHNRYCVQVHCLLKHENMAHRVFMASHVSQQNRQILSNQR
jgi:hypothetical protein